ncbi:MAG TPA: peptidylprolyl isomerase [Vicinamibacterales bacterium]
MFRTFLFSLAIALCACSKVPANASTNAAQASGGGQSRSGAPGSGAQAAAPQPAKPIPAQLPEVVARVNGEPVTKADFERALSTLEGRAGGPVPQEQRDQVFRRLLDQIVGYKLLTQETQTRKVDVPAGEIDARVKEIQGQFPSEAAFKEMLTARKTTIEQLRTDVKQDLAVQKMIDAEIAPKIVVKPEQLADFYAKNPDQFKQPERVRASHILIGVPRDADAAAKTQARAKADQILKDVKAGKDFATLAKQNSQDPGSAANGGDLGFFQQGQMVGPFNDAAFKLAPGTVSDIVETEFGFHIIKVIEKQPARTVSLDEVKPQLEQFLLQRNRQEQTDGFVNGLRSKGKIEILI